MASFCAIRPASDAPARELSTWCANLFDHISRTGHRVSCDLHGPAATRISIPSATSGVRCALFFGHGSRSALFGADGREIVDAANVGRALGSIVVAVACHSAAELGPAAILSGVQSYLGFDDLLLWLAGDPDGLFEMAATSGIREIISGSTMGTGFETTSLQFRKVADSYLRATETGVTNSTLGWIAALSNAEHLRLLGSRSATL